MTHRDRLRRVPGSCEDCGHGPVREIRFWVNDMPYRVCAEHEREYVRQGAWVTERGYEPSAAVLARFGR